MDRFYRNPHEWRDARVHISWLDFAAVNIICSKFSCLIYDQLFKKNKSIVNDQWMHLFSLFRQTTDDYGSFNQSAITSTGATVPLYFHKRQYSYTRTKDRSGSKKIYQANESKRHYALRSMESAQELGFASADRQAMLSFDQITKSKRRKIFLHRLFFTFICLLVLLVIIALTMILIIRFSWIFCNSTLLLFSSSRLMCEMHEEKWQQKPKVVKGEQPQLFPSPKTSVYLVPKTFFFNIRDSGKRIYQRRIERHRRVHNHLGIDQDCRCLDKSCDNLGWPPDRVCISELGSLRIKSERRPRGSRARGNACWPDQSKRCSSKKTIERISEFYIPKRWKVKWWKYAFDRWNWRDFI